MKGVNLSHFAEGGSEHQDGNTPIASEGVKVRGSLRSVTADYCIVRQV